MSTQAKDQPMVERRRGPRRIARLPVRLSWSEGDLQYREETSTVCISQFGCGAQSRHNLPPSTVVTLEFEGRTFAGKVSYVLRSSAAELYELGIAFDRDGSEFWGTQF